MVTLFMSDVTFMFTLNMFCLLKTALDTENWLAFYFLNTLKLHQSESRWKSEFGADLQKAPFCRLRNWCHLCFDYPSVEGKFQRVNILCGSSRENGAVPQAEGQQCAWLLVEFQMDTLQLSCSNQLMRNNGCWTLTLQTVLPTPKTHMKRRKVECNKREI